MGEQPHLLFSVGRSIDGPTEFQCYAAYRFTFGNSFFHFLANHTLDPLGSARFDNELVHLRTNLGRFASLTAVLAKVGVSGVNSNVATAISTSVILVFTWAIAFVTARDAIVVALTRRTWIFLVLSALATGLSWRCYFRALQRGEASKVAPVDKLGVVFVTALAVLFLGEKLM